MQLISSKLYRGGLICARSKRRKTFHRTQIPTAQLNWAEVKTISIGSKEWVYHLLIFPQPDGTKLRVHHLSRIFEDGSYVSFDIKGGDPAEGLAFLNQIASDIK